MKQCIAFPTDDRKTIFLRTGRVKGFLLFTVDDNTVVSENYAENSHQEHDHPANEPEEEHSHPEIVALLKGCDMVIVRAIGKHMKRDFDLDHIPYRVVKTDIIYEALQEYLQSL